MVHRLVALLLRTVLEHREVHDPEEPQRIGIDQSTAASHLKAQLAECLCHDERLVGDDEEQISRLCPDGILDRLKGLVGVELLEGRLYALLRVLNPRQSLCAVALHIGDETVQLTARDIRIALDVDDLHAAARLHDGVEHLEVRAADIVRNVLQLHAEAQIGLVRAEAIHRLIPRHALEGRLDLRADALFKQLFDHPLHEREDAVLIHKGHLDIELRELRLTVGAQILVAEAAHDLEVFLKARDHEQLLEDLRGLRQRIELARIETTRHEEVACPLGRALAEHRRLDLKEIVAVKEIAHDLRHAMTQDHIRLHLGAAQIEVAIAQTDHLVHIDAILNIERRRLCLVENPQLADDDLDLPCCHVRIDRLRTACAHRAAHTENELRAQRLRLVERPLCHCRLIEDDLHKSRAVTHIDKDQPAVVTAARHPAAQRYLCPHLLLAQCAAAMCPFHSLHRFHLRPSPQKSSFLPNGQAHRSPAHSPPYRARLPYALPAHPRRE